MPNRLLIAAAIALAFLAVTLAFVFRPVDEDNAIRLTPDDAAVVARGREVYAAECAACHGAELQGQPNWQQRNTDGLLPAPPHDASGHTWHHPDAMLFALTKHGPQAVAGPQYSSAMPAYAETLGDADILAVLSYIKSTWPADIRARHDDINARYDASQQ